jgi:hypothetical protein
MGLIPNQVVDLPIPLQRNSNSLQRNSNITATEFQQFQFCALLNCFAVVDFRGLWWTLVDFGARSPLKSRFSTITENPRNSTCLCGIDFQCRGSGCL